MRRSWGQASATLSPREGQVEPPRAALEGDLAGKACKSGQYVQAGAAGEPSLGLGPPAGALEFAWVFEGSGQF